MRCENGAKMADFDHVWGGAWHAAAADRLERRYTERVESIRTVSGGVITF